MADFVESYLFTLINEAGDPARPDLPIDWRVHQEPGGAGPVCAGVDLDQFKAYWASPAHPWPPTPETAPPFYRATFWEPIRGDEIEVQAIATAIYDAGVNTWWTHPAEVAQLIVGVPADGIIGPMTLAALNSPEWGSATFLPKFFDGMAAYYRSLTVAWAKTSLDEWIGRLESNARRLGVAWKSAV